VDIAPASGTDSRTYLDKSSPPFYHNIDIQDIGDTSVPRRARQPLRVRDDRGLEQYQESAVVCDGRYV